MHNISTYAFLCFNPSHQSSTGFSFTSYPQQTNIHKHTNLVDATERLSINTHTACGLDLEEAIHQGHSQAAIGEQFF